MLTFDEFHAVNNRERQRKLNNTVNPPTIIDKTPLSAVGVNAADTKDKADTKPSTSIVASAINGVGDFLEMYQMQGLYVLLVIADTFACIADLSIRCHAHRTPSIMKIANLQVVVHVLQSTHAFTSAFFSIEIVAVFIIFGFSMFTHWGYLLDTLVTLHHFYLNYLGYSTYARLLNVFRFWRMLRLFNALIGAEQDLHRKTQQTVEQYELEMKRLNLENSSLRSDIEREKEAKDAIEGMLINYKEEVDTLNEALKIAAMDIAEVAQTEDDFELSDEEDDELDTLGNTNTISTAQLDEYDEDGIRYQDAYGSRFSKKMNKSTVMRAVMDDASVGSGSGSGMRSSMSMAVGSSTFLIHEDGTFEQK